MSRLDDGERNCVVRTEGIQVQVSNGIQVVFVVSCLLFTERLLYQVRVRRVGQDTFL